MHRRFIISCTVLGLLGGAVHAKNVDLSTVPKREGVQLTIYNSEDITLVRDTRKVSFKQGNNPLQFSWANTRIDPTSVQLRFLTHPDKLTLSDTVFPHAKPHMLYWNVASELDGDALVEITYFTSGITWSADYVAIANQDETTMSFESFVRVTNHSGEDYEDAKVRLVVGKINLVEKIAQLANIPTSQVHKLPAPRRSRLRNEAAGLMMQLAEAAVDDMPADMPAEREKQIVKEGLSEYFIFTIDGTETVPNGWSKRMRSLNIADVPFNIQYRYRPREYGNQLVRLYLLTNDKDSKLGDSPLPDGMVRVFRQTGDDTLAFLAAVHSKYVPIGDKFELNLGRDREVLFELVKQRTWRDNIWMWMRGAKVFRKVGNGQIKIEPKSTVAGWDDHTLYVQRIRNFTSKAIDVEMRRTYGGDVTFLSGFDATKHDYATVQFSAEVPAMSEVKLPFEVVIAREHNAKQKNVKLGKLPK